MGLVNHVRPGDKRLGFGPIGGSPNQYLSLAQLTAMMHAAGVRRLYVKQLAPNDNSKNQIYFGPGFQAVNIFPNLGITTTAHKTPPIFKASLLFYWIDARGSLHRASGAQMILYPQYPEVRLSGFLKGCNEAPSQVMASREPGRILFLGVTDDGNVLAHAVSGDGKAALEFRSLEDLPMEGVFSRLVLGAAKFGADARDRLLRELGRIHRKEWIPSKRLMPDGKEVQCNNRNCGGLTLEAEFGIKPNSSIDPDFMGWELKQHSVTNLANPGSGGAITLVTQEPTGGFYKEKGFHGFVRKFGYADKLGRADRINFGGVHKVGKPQKLTGLTLTLVGYDPSTGKITDQSGRVALLDAGGEEAATWSFTDLMTHWNRKHPFAAYVPSMHDIPENSYRYGQIVRLGEGTDFLHFLRGMSNGNVYYDPGIKLEDSSTAHPKSKRRSQFRTRSADLPFLYDKMEANNVL
jgi:hypothetical protein